MSASRILAALPEQAAHTKEPAVLGQRLVEAIAQHLPIVSWVGIYWLVGRDLVLGPYSGAPPKHPRIPAGEGVCGRAVLEDADQCVEDVRRVPHYLACDPAVRSELVVLIRSSGQVVGQIDLDAPKVGAFDKRIQCVLRAVADCFGALLDDLPVRSPVAL